MKTNQTLSLLEIGQTIINNEKIQEKELKSPLILFSKHIKELKGLLPDNVPIFKVYRDKNGLLGYLTIGIYQEENNPIVVLPNQNADTTDLFSIELFKVQNGFITGIITHNGINLIIPTPLSDRGKLYVIDNPNHEVLVEDFDYLLLKDRPNLEIPLRNLEIGKVYEIIGTGKKSKQYNTSLIDLKSEDEEVIKNVICNSFLSLFSANTDNSRKFTITEINEVKRKVDIGKKKKDGTPKWEHRTITLVNVCPVTDSKKLTNL